MGSPFTKLITKTLPMLGDEEHTITIRRLNPKQLTEARNAVQREVLELMKETIRELTKDDDVVTSGIMRALLSDRPTKPAAAEASTNAPAIGVDPLTRYDPLTLIRHGVIGWTYDLELSAENFAEIDEERREWLAREILRLTKPALFEAEETAKKND